MEEDADQKQRQRQNNDGNAKGVAEPVYRVLMAGGILRDPLFICASAKHGA